MKYIHKTMQSILKREREVTEKLEKDRASHERRKLAKKAKKLAKSAKKRKIS